MKIFQPYSAKAASFLFSFLFLVYETFSIVYRTTFTNFFCNKIFESFGRIFSQENHSSLIKNTPNSRWIHTWCLRTSWDWCWKKIFESFGRIFLQENHYSLLKIHQLVDGCISDAWERREIDVESSSVKLWTTVISWCGNFFRYIDDPDSRILFANLKVHDSFRWIFIKKLPILWYFHNNLNNYNYTCLYSTNVKYYIKPLSFKNSSLLTSRRHFINVLGIEHVFYQHGITILLRWLTSASKTFLWVTSSARETSVTCFLLKASDIGQIC